MKVVTNDIHYQNIGDALRAHGFFDSEKNFPPEEMAEAILFVIGKSYDSGKEKGCEEGKKTEQNTFWEIFQDGGSRTYYNYAFYGSSFNDENYNPIYPIKIRSNNTNAFYQCGATDSKVVIDIGAYDLNNTFRYAKFVTMRMNIAEGANVKTAFTNMSALKNLAITGKIGRSFDVSDSPLTVTSLKNLVTVLKDYTGTNEYAYTLTVNASAFSKLEAEGATAEHDGTPCTWAELVDNKKWNLTLA